MSVNITLVLVLITLIIPVWSRPQESAAGHSPSSTQVPIPIISHSESVGLNGSYNFSYESGNGIHVQESGYLKKGQPGQGEASKDLIAGNGDIQVIVGSYAYKSPEGVDISLQYTADENGFQPVGAHLPTPPPIPPEIQKALSIPRKSPEPQQQKAQQSVIDVIQQSPPDGFTAIPNVESIL